MKKKFMAALAVVAVVLGAAACSNQSKENDSANDTPVVEGEVVGSEVVMPTSDSDTTVVAQGTAIVVEQTNN